MKFTALYNVALSASALLRVFNVDLVVYAKVSVTKAALSTCTAINIAKAIQISKSVKIFLKKNFDRFAIDG